MAKIFLPLCGAAFLGFAVLTTGASAGSLPTAGDNVTSAATAAQLPIETVGWRQTCRPVPRWFNGRQVLVERCHNVWVDWRGQGDGYGRRDFGPPGPGYGYGRPQGGRPPGPAYGYGGPYRGGPGFY